MKFKNGTTVWKTVLLTSASAVGAIVVMGAALGLLVTNEILTHERAHTIMMVAVIACVFIASWIGATRGKMKRLAVSGAVCGLCIVLLLLLRSIMFADQKVIFDHRLIVTMGVFIPAGLLASRKKVRKR